MTKLKQYFPMIRERQEILDEIRNRQELEQQFDNWSKEQQEEFLDFCSGVKGLKLLYDGFFKNIMDPEKKPERLDDFLSQMLRQKVKVLMVLPVDSGRIADESSLVIMDIVVELEDGSIANVEMQRVGFLFPGQRSACYSADLLLRQYRRVRGERKKKFSYKDIKNVYTIVLYDKSPREFHKYPGQYYHYFEQTSDTGLKLELLQKYLFIPLDIFREKRHNKDIKDKRDGWLTLFASDDPDSIISLLERYPEFREIYEEAYGICRNVEEVMSMFSRELYELDKNTVQYMIDEMQDTIDAQKNTIAEKENTIAEKESTIVEKENTIARQKDIIENSIRHTITMMKKLGTSDEEIIVSLKEQYHLNEEDVQQYIAR